MTTRLMPTTTRTAQACPRCGQPALFISGYAHAALVQHALLPPGAEFLQKPLEERNLVRRVRQILDARPPRRT